MSQHISRRRLLRSAIKSGVGFAVLRQLNVAPVRVLASYQPKTDRADTDFRPAFARLDDFIAGHKLTERRLQCAANEIGAIVRGNHNRNGFGQVQIAHYMSP